MKISDELEEKIRSILCDIGCGCCGDVHWSDAYKELKALLEAEESK